MFIFKKKDKDKNKKLYKVVYKTAYGTYNSTYTLLVSGKSPADAIETFYEKVKGGVTDIVEFTEITYGSEEKKEDSNGV